MKSDEVKVGWRRGRNGWVGRCSATTINCRERLSGVLRFYRRRGVNEW